MPRVVLISPAFPEILDSPVADYTKNLAASLFGQGHSVDILTKADPRVLPAFKKIQVHKIIKNWNLFDLRAVVPTLQLIKPEILHIISPEAASLIPALLEMNKMLFKLPVITTFLDFGATSMREGLWLRSIISNSDIVTVTQKSQQARLQKMNLAKTVDVLLWAEEKRAAFQTDLNERQKWDLNTSDTVMGVWGNLTRDNGLYELFKSALPLIQRNSHFKIFFIQRTQPSAKERNNLIEYLDKNNILNQVFFSGALSTDELERAKKVADFFVFLSHVSVENSLPVDLRVALHSQTPCMAWNPNRDYSEFGLAHGKNIWLSSFKNIRALRADLELLFTNSKLRDELKMGATSFSRTFSLDAVSNEISRLYSTLL